MKHIKTPPQDNQFFSRYASLVKTLRLSGYLGQVVSALTEIGGLYVAAMLTLSPILPAPWDMYASAFIAAIGTLILEVGLRASLPKAIDAILHRHFKGLDLALTALTFVIVVVLLAGSGFLSFTNSTIIVKDMTAGQFEQRRAALDSLKAASLDSIGAIYAAKRMQADSFYNEVKTRKAATEAAREKAAKTAYYNVLRMQDREGVSFATRRDEAKLKWQEAQAATEAATLQITQEQRAAIGSIDDKEEAAKSAIIASIEGKAGKVTADQESTVRNYGGGLAYFTIICLLLLIVSIAVDRIVHKGAKIEETVQLSQYDINPHWYIMLKEALSNRFNYHVQSWIVNFSNKTPAPPLPEDIEELYNPAEVANIIAKLKLKEGEEEGGEYEIGRKRIRAFGGQSEESASAAHDFSYSKAIKELNKYKKRLSSHLQKRANLERRGAPVPMRTTNAIENNKQWVNYWQNIVNQHKGA